jgi:LacI family transcriptional regulator
MIKLKDVARKAAVSEATASLVLNRKKGVSALTRERVLSAAQALGYTPNSIARGLATRRTHSIGLVVTDIENPFFGSLTRFVDEFTLSRGCTLVLSVSNDDPVLEEKIISFFIGKRVEGVIIVPTITRRETFRPLDELRRHKIPYVFSTVYYPGAEGDCVMTDLRRGSYLLGRYLLGLGHREILFLASNDRSSPVSALRIQGLEKAIREAGSSGARLGITECPKPNFSCGYATARDALRKGTPDAVIAINDIMALGAERAARDAGLRIPQDISVCGYDDVVFARVAEVPLTTVRQDTKRIAARSVDVLFSRITGSAAAPRLHRVSPELVIRESSGPCRRAAGRLQSRAQKGRQ